MGRKHKGKYCDPETGHITDEGYELIETAAGLGLRMPEIAALLGIGVRTLHARIKEEEERGVEDGILAALADGKAEIDLQVSASLVKQCKKGNVAAIKWFEMTRSGRAEKVEAEVETTQRVIALPDDQSEEDWEKENSPATVPETA